MGLTLRDQRHYTYADYLSWDDEQRYELIDGFAYAMAPAPSTIHQKLLFELSRYVANSLDESPCSLFIAPIDVRLTKGDEANDKVDTVVQPDILVVCDSDKIDEKGIRGAPDWIAEVLSPSTASHDSILKRDIYERYGVREYWLVHPVDRIATIYRLIDGTYGKPDVVELAGETGIGILPEVIIDWERVTRDL